MRNSLRLLTMGGCAAGVLLAATAIAQTSSAPWAGTYRGDFDGGIGEVVIKGPSPNGANYQVQADVAGRGTGCSGSVGGVATAQGQTLTLEVPTMDRGLCTVSFMQTASGLRVEASGCSEFSGASCGFNGAMRRVGAASSPPPASVSRPVGPAWLLNDGGESLVMDAAGLGIALTVGCDADEGVPFIALGVVNQYGQVESSGPASGRSAFARRFQGFRTGTLFAYDARGVVIAQTVFKPHPMSGGQISLIEGVDSRVLAALKRAARIEVQSNLWTASFSGTGSARVIDRGSCGSS